VGSGGLALDKVLKLRSSCVHSRTRRRRAILLFDYDTRAQSAYSKNCLCAHFRLYDAGLGLR